MTLDAIAERVSRGDPLSEEDARAVLETPDLIAVGSLADEIRRNLRGIETTFVRVMEVHVEAPPSAIPSTVEAGELRIVGTPSNAEAAIEGARAVAAIAGRVPVTGFSIPHLTALAADKDALESLCVALKQAGLSAIAEVAVDTTEDLDAIRTARRAGLAVLRLTVDSARGRGAGTILRAQRFQRELGGFRAFAPLPRHTSPTGPTTGYDDVKQIALARLMLPDVPSIQVDWQLYGPKLAQVTLTMGADDVDGVAAMDATDLGHRRSAYEEVTRNIRAAALEPFERNGLFEKVG